MSALRRPPAFYSRGKSLFLNSHSDGRVISQYAQLGTFLYHFSETYGVGACRRVASLPSY
ncbi:protein of unknown function [Candidatus Filomicrobium marinum]|uniref:Uncharacterized protein n=1 Tax=Candidatus Filomicrobium marinum TaxID=1608628 RepID=A0A0D6JEN1_9HYPH|nr:protein of unknown function [Candidatus Filomicrobium marinum]CPR18022.1 protein of unknown function [Candidatus Filomicrobium marinum]